MLQPEHEYGVIQEFFKLLALPSVQASDGMGWAETQLFCGNSYSSGEGYISSLGRSEHTLGRLSSLALMLPSVFS